MRHDITLRPEEPTDFLTVENKKYTRATIIVSSALIIVAIVLTACTLGSGSNGQVDGSETTSMNEGVDSAEIGIIPDNFDVPDAVLARAVEFVKNEYETGADIESQRENGAIFDNWRLDKLERLLVYADRGVSVYSFEWRMHTTTPDKIIVAGAQHLDKDGWFLDTYPNAWHLITIDNDAEGNDIKLIVPMFVNDLTPGTDQFSAEVDAVLEKARTHMGYISNMNTSDGTFDFEEVEWLTLDDSDRLAELGVDPNSLPNGFYVHDLGLGKRGLNLTAITSFNVLNLEDNDPSHRTIPRDLVEEYLEVNGGSYILWRVVLDGDDALRITEQYGP